MTETISCTISLSPNFLTNTLNEMHSYMEMSDYQVAAKLLHLPSQITSEVYGYSNPFGYIAYKKYIQSQENHSKKMEELFSCLNDKRDQIEREQIEDNGIIDDLDEFIVDYSKGLQYNDE